MIHHLPYESAFHTVNEIDVELQMHTIGNNVHNINFFLFFMEDVTENERRFI